MQRLDDPTIYNPYGWRLAELDAGADDDRRRRLLDGLAVWEAQEAAHGYRHVTVVHGDPNTLAESRRLSGFYEQLATIVEGVPWRRVRGTAEYVTVTVSGPHADRVIADIIAAAAAVATDERWAALPTAVPSGAGA